MLYSIVHEQDAQRIEGSAESKHILTTYKRYISTQRVLSVRNSRVYCLQVEIHHWCELDEKQIIMPIYVWWPKCNENEWCVNEQLLYIDGDIYILQDMSVKRIANGI